MSSRTLFIVSIAVAFILGIVAFAPISNNPLSIPHLSKLLGFGKKEEESKQKLVRERQERAERNLQGRIKDLQQDQKILMENRKDQVSQAQDLSQQQLTSPTELRQKVQQQAQLLQQQKDLMEEKQQTEEERQKELKDQQDRQMMEMRQKIKDQQDMMRDRMDKW